MPKLFLSRQERNQLFQIADEFTDFDDFKDRFTEWKSGAKWANEDYLLLDEKDESRVTFLCALLRRELDRQGDIEKILDYMKVQIHAIANFNVIQPVMPCKKKIYDKVCANAEFSKDKIETRQRVIECIKHEGKPSKSSNDEEVFER